MARSMRKSNVEWITEIPDDWKEIPIKYVATYNDECLGEDTDANFEFDYIEIGSVQYGKGIVTTEHMMFRNAPSRARRIVKKGDIIISTVRTYLKAVAEVIDDNQVASTGFVVIRPKTIDTGFLKYSVLADNFISTVEAYSTGISYPAINSSRIVGFKIPLPNEKEQKNISAYLDLQCSYIDCVLEKTCASIDEYKKLKQSVITQAITNGICVDREMRDSGSIWYGEIPADWEMKKIKYLFSIKKDIAGEEGHTILSITQRGIVPKDLSKNEGQLASDYSNYQIVNIGDFAMNHMDLLTGWVDISKYEGVTSPDYRVFVLDNYEENSSEYYLYVMQMCYMDKIFYGLGQGVSGLGRWRLQADKFMNFEVAVPPKEEQIEIAQYLDRKCSEIDKLIAKKEQLVVELEAMKKSLIYEYVTGKKEVPNA